MKIYILLYNIDVWRCYMEIPDLFDEVYSHTYYEICRHLFLFAIKAGMDMQKAFDEQP